MRSGRALDPRPDSSDQIDTMIDNIGLPTAPHQSSPTALRRPVGPADADIMVSPVREHTTNCQVYPRSALAADLGIPRRDVLLPARRHGQPDPGLRRARPDRPPGSGIQLGANHEFAVKLTGERWAHPGIVDLRIQQPFNQPKLHVNIDRTKASRWVPQSRTLPETFTGFLERKLSDDAGLLARPRDGSPVQCRDDVPTIRLPSLQDLENIPEQRQQRRSQMLASVASRTVAWEWRPCRTTTPGP